MIELSSVSLCNKCGLHPKYPQQGLCKLCYFKKQHDKWVASRPDKKIIPDLEGEIWADLKEAPGYQISNMGRVKSLNYFGETGRHHVLKLRAARKGSYLKADLDKYNWRPSVHRLVAKYFIPNPDSLPLVLHKDEDKQNNAVINLYWGTKSQNRIDYIKDTDRRGIIRKKMSKDLVLKIFVSQESVQSIALKYEISTSTVWMIKTGYRWSRVTGVKNTDKRNAN